MKIETPRRYAFLQERAPKRQQTRERNEARHELKMPPTLKTRLRKEAARVGLSMNDWIRIAITAALDRAALNRREG